MIANRIDLCILDSYVQPWQPCQRPGTTKRTFSRPRTAMATTKSSERGGILNSDAGHNLASLRTHLAKAQKARYKRTPSSHPSNNVWHHTRTSELVDEGLGGGGERDWRVRGRDGRGGRDGVVVVVVAAMGVWTGELEAESAALN